MFEKKRRDRIAVVLGASRTIQLKGRKLGGPLDWLNLSHNLQSRLISQGGRPSDPRWNTKRLVPFQRKTWKSLMEKADAISAEGRKVGPAQLAAILIEEGLMSRTESSSSRASGLFLTEILKKDGLLLHNTENIEAQTAIAPFGFQSQMAVRIKEQSKLEPCRMTVNSTVPLM